MEMKLVYPAHSKEIKEISKEEVVFEEDLKKYALEL